MKIFVKTVDSCLLLKKKKNVAFNAVFSEKIAN